MISLAVASSSCEALPRARKRMLFRYFFAFSKPSSELEISESARCRAPGPSAKPLIGVSPS